MRLIDADAFRKEIEVDKYGNINTTITKLNIAMERSAVDAVGRKKGKWIPQFDKWGDYVTTTEGYKCSECGEFDTMKDNFCPNCGADMRGEADDFGKTDATFGNKSEK